MKPLLLIILVALYVVSTAAGCAKVSNADASAESARRCDPSRKKTLRPFRSEQELTSFFREIAEAQKRERADLQKRQSSAPQASAGNMNANMFAAESEEVSVSADSSVTNVQHAGVDEGGIVKSHGDYLVVLRRGRLFTMRIGDGDLRPISTVDAFAPDVDPREAWYDEMLISGDRIAVIGYSYRRGGTEIGLFQIKPGGALRYQATYHLRSNDYYSSRNYASRLVEGKLVFYTPLYLSPADEDPLRAFPSP